MSDFTKQRQRARSVRAVGTLRKRNRSRAPGLESLEERVVLSTITWNNREISDLNWDTASNWLGGVVPGANDDAVLNLHSGTVTFSAAGGESVHSISTNTATGFAITSGSLTVAAPSNFQTLTLSGGTLAGSGAVTVKGALAWSGGTMTGTGSTEAKTVLTLGQSSGNSASTLTLSGGRSLINDVAATGAANGAALTLNVSGSSTITNKAGATFTFTSNSSVLGNGNLTDGTIINQGTLATNGGAGTTTIGLPITNTGTIQAQTGILSIGFGSIFSAATQLKASAGASLAFAAGTYAIPAGASVNGAGGLLVNGATVSFAGSYNFSGLTEIDSGEVDFNGTSALGSLILGGTLGGTGSVTVNGQTTWTAGAMTGAGSTEAKAGLALGQSSGNSASILTLSGGRSLINDGAASGAANGAALTLNVSDGSTITNKSGATFTFTSNGSIVNNGGSPAGGTIINQGTLGTNGGAGTTTIGLPITNNGTLRAQTGTLVVSDGSTFASGTQIEASAGATLSFPAGTFVFPSSATVAGAGGLLVNGATITFAGIYNFSGLTEIDSGEVIFNGTSTLGSLILGGTLGGTGAVTVNGQTTWTAGAMTGHGSTEAKGGLTLGFSNGNTPGLLALSGGRSLINAAAANAAANGAGLVLNVSDGSTITNKSGATINILSNSTIANNGGAPAGGTFTNQGIFVTNGGIGTTTIALPVTNTGTLSVQTGALDLTGGLTNFNVGNSSLTGGTYIVKGHLNFANAKIVTNKASITLNTANSDIRDLNGVSALGTFTVNNPAGSFLSLLAGRNLTVDSFTTAGSLSVASGCVFTSTGAFIQNGGTTTLGGGTLTSSTNGVTVNSGTLSARGTINGDLNFNGGSFSPGGSGGIGLLTVNGNYTQGSLASFSIQIAGTNPGTSYDRLAITGTAALNGSLTLSLLNNYVPAAGVSYRPLTFASRTGDFSAKNGLNLGPAVLAAVYDATGLNLTDNVAPTIPAVNPTLDSNGGATFNLTAADPETSASTLIFTITSLPSGTLTMPDGTPVTVGQTFTGSPVALVYQAPSVIFDNFTASFGFTVNDDGTPNGVVATTASTVNLSLAGPSAGVASIFGPAGDDTILATNAGGNLQVTINGVVNNTGIPVSSITQINVIGGNGNDTIELSGLAINSTITAGGGTNILIIDGTLGADTFNINSSTSIGVNGATITASSPLTINGLAGNDTFNILVPNLATILNGGDDNDTFVFANGASLATPLDGGNGTNTIDESAVTTVLTLSTDTSTLSGLSVPYANIQSVIGGSNAANFLNGPAAGSIYNITGANAGSVAGLSFAGFGNIAAGVGNDSFVFSDAATLSGSLSAGGGSDTIDQSAYTTAVAVNPPAGIVTGIVGGFSGVQTFIGSSTAFGTLTGPSAASTYNITAANAGNVGAVAFSNYSRIFGGPGNDLFKLSAGASLAGAVDGGGGTNSIDESAYTTPVALNLATRALTGMGTPYANIQAITPGSGANSLTGPSAASTFTITGSNTGTVAGFNFNKFGTLIGGAGNDVFKFTGGALLSGGTNGGGGSNTLDYSTFSTQVNLNLATSSASRITSPFSNIQSVIAGTFAGNQLLGPSTSTNYFITGANSGNVNGTSFAGFSRIVAANGNDTFKFSNGASLSSSIEGGNGTNVIDESAYTTPMSANLAATTITGIGGTYTNIRIITGGSASNTITGPATDSIFTITGTNTAIVGTVTFAKFGTIIGGAGNDTFKFGSTALITGTINGGAGTNTFDYSALTSQASVNLVTSTASRVTNPFQNIQTFIGGTSTGNFIQGPSANTTYNITAANVFNVNGVNFSSFGKIVGGAGDDTFVLSNGAGLSNKIDGGTGSNWLDYDAYTTGVTVNLTSGAATGFGAAISNIGSVRGGSGNDILTGGTQGSTLIGGAGNDKLIGNSARNLLIGGTGVDTVIGGSADDIVIGGSSTFDNNFAALDSILSEWKSTSDSYATRVNLIQNGGGLNGTNTLNLGTTVIDDLAANVLTGNAGTDWFFKGTNDTITDLQAGEQVN